MVCLKKKFFTNSLKNLIQMFQIFFHTGLVYMCVYGIIIVFNRRPWRPRLVSDTNHYGCGMVGMLFCYFSLSPIRENASSARPELEHVIILLLTCLRACEWVCVCVSTAWKITTRSFRIPDCCHFVRYRPLADVCETGSCRKFFYFFFFFVLRTTFRRHAECAVEQTMTEVNRILTFLANLCGYGGARLHHTRTFKTNASRSSWRQRKSNSS
jgi:hypothetical protein